MNRLSLHCAIIRRLIGRDQNRKLTKNSKIYGSQKSSRDVIKGKMVVLLNVQQKSCLKISFLYLWKKTKLLHQGEFQELVKKLCADLASPCLLDMNLDYSLDTLPSDYLTYNFFLFYSHVSSWKNNFSFQLWMWRTLFTSFTHGIIFTCD